jgi:protein SCO1/2
MRKPPTFRSDRGTSAVSRCGVLLLWLSMGAAFGAEPAVMLKAGVFEPARMAPDFTLRGSNGSDLTLSRYRGKLVLLAFGYTSCTEVCPITMAVLARARKELGASGADLQVLYVTVDPERDSVERMHQYLANFDPSFIGATGTEQQLAAVRKAYGIVATKMPVGDSYAVAHSSSVYIVDRDGSLRAMMPFGHSADDYVHDIKLLLKK